MECEGRGGEYSVFRMTEGNRNFGKKMGGKKMGTSQRTGRKDLLRRVRVTERR